MGEATHPAALDAAIEACADCVRIYRAAAETVEDGSWERFLSQMALRRETLLHRLRFLAGGPVEQHETEDLVGLRGRFAEVVLAVKGLFSDHVSTALASAEPAEARLAKRLDAVCAELGETRELREMMDAVGHERQAVQNLLAGMGGEATLAGEVGGERSFE